MCLYWRGSVGRIAGWVAFFSGGGGDFGFEFKSWDGVVFVVSIASLMEWF